jgi:hypothetical protein
MGDKEIILGDTVGSAWHISEDITESLFNHEKPKRMKAEVNYQINEFLLNTEPE